MTPAELHARFEAIKQRVDAKLATGQLLPRPIIRTHFHYADLGGRSALEESPNRARQGKRGRRA